MADVEIVMLHFFFSNYDLQFSIGQNQNWIVNPFFHQEKCHKILTFSQNKTQRNLQSTRHICRLQLKATWLKQNNIVILI